MKLQPREVVTGLLTAEAQRALQGNKVTLAEATRAEEAGVSAALDAYHPAYEKGGVHGNADPTFTAAQAAIFEAAYRLALPKAQAGLMDAYVAVRPAAQQMPQTAAELAQVFGDVARFCYDSRANEALDAVAEGSATRQQRLYLAQRLLDEVSRTRDFGDGVMVLGPNAYDASPSSRAGGQLSEEANFARAMLVALRLRDALDAESGAR